MSSSATAATPASPPSVLRRLSGALYRRPRLVLAALLTPPILWLVVVYLGSLSLMFLSSFWRLDPTTSAIVREPSLANFQDVLDPSKPYLRIAHAHDRDGDHRDDHRRVARLPDRLLHGPGGAAADASAAVHRGPRCRSGSSYLVRVYAWRIILSDRGLPGLGASARSGSRARVRYGDVAIASCSATSGCRT